MVGKVLTLGVQGIHGYQIDVECFLAGGLPAFDVVGLPDAAVKESRERIKAAARCCGYNFPQRRVVMNLAPADTKKTGSLYDLPMLLSLLQCTHIIDAPPENGYFLGELSLEGNLRGGPGVLPMALACPSGAVLFVPKANAAEAALCQHLRVYAADHVKQIIDHLNGDALIQPTVLSDDFFDDIPDIVKLDFADVRGQDAAKRAMEIAAAGNHSILLEGPPGAGKSMLTMRLPSILPPMSFEESIECTKIYSVAGLLPDKGSLVTERPFRSPHHTLSQSAMTGGGKMPKPGEISLAHNGVLFLDELPEFQKHTLEALRQPLEDGVVTISRVSGTITYPSDFMLVASMNPCPCGFYGDYQKCSCTMPEINRYLSRISGPLLDRIDIMVETPKVDYEKLRLNSGIRPESSADIKTRVERAQEVQTMRYGAGPVRFNAQLTAAMIEKHCKLDAPGAEMLRLAFDKMGLSARAYHKILRLARTIADLDGEEDISVVQLAEAIQYRALDRKYWS